MTPFKELVEVHSTAESAEPAPTQDEISKLAYTLWQQRGCPNGSPEVDWLEAEEELTENQS
jgi:hypothetical protein